MPDLSPAETITAAAHKLRLAATADYITPPPWISLDGGDRLIHDPGHDLDKPIYVVPEPMDNPSNAEYIALMHPGVGLALAELLDEFEESITECGGIVVHSTQEAALAVARALLGGGS